MSLNRAFVSSQTRCVTLVITFTNEEFIPGRSFPAGKICYRDGGKHGHECPEKVRQSGWQHSKMWAICLLSARISEN